MKKPLLIACLCLSQYAFSQTQILSQPAFHHNKKNAYEVSFQKAYSLYPDIPKGMLEAVAFTTTRINHLIPDGKESCTGIPPAYGVMGLILDGKGYFRNNLNLISEVSGCSTKEIISDPEKNILAYAKAYAVLLNDMRLTGTAIEKQIPVLVKLSELPDNDLQTNFALNSHLYSVCSFLNSTESQLRYGFPTHNIDLISAFGEENYRVLSAPSVIISETEIENTEGVQYKNAGGNNSNVQSTDYGPAVWNAAASCNYSSRGGTPVSAVVIHDVEGTYAGCISWFKNCNANVSAHYVVRSSDGQITQMVLESTKAWHVGTHNPYTIGIEHEGYRDQNGWYTTAMYTSSAALVKDICNSGYGINPTTCYKGPSCNDICTLSSSFKIKGHQHYSSQSHNDPGPKWDWYTYYDLINGSTSSCGTPSGLSASAITASGSTLNWNTVTNAGSYNVKYRKSGTTTWTSLTSSTNSKAISGLSASTVYEFQVQAVCSGTPGNFSSSATFTTSSTPLTNDNCSTAIELTSNVSCVNMAGSIAGATSSGLAKASCDVGTSLLNDVWYKFTATGSSHTVTLSPSSGFDAVLALYNSCTGGQVGCSDNGGGPGGPEKIIATTLTAGTTYYIRIYKYGTGSPSTSTFNICVTNPVPPSCGIPSNLSATAIGSSSATLNWASVSGAASYNIQYRKVSTATWSNATSAITSKTISGLTPSTSYEFQVQAVCSGAPGSYSSSANFTTTAITGTNDNCANAFPLTSDVNCITTSGDLAGATPSGLAKATCDAGTSPMNDVWYQFTASGASHTITLTPSSGLDGVLALYTSCSGGQVGCSDNGGGPGGIEKIIATALAAGTTYYIRIYKYGSGAPSTTTFNICITNPAVITCGIPSNLSATSIAENSATLTWTAVTGATSYNVQYRKANTSAWTNTNSSTNSKMIASLSAATSYEFQVQAVCSGTPGNFSASSSFTTLTPSSTTSTITVGTGTSLYSAHPYGTVYMDERTQYIITKSELIAAGWSSSTSTIKSLAFNVSAASSQAMNNFTISLAHTASSAFSTTSFTSGTNTTTVYTGTTTAATGWNTYNFTAPFTYNGTDNLLITICWNNSGFSVNSSVFSKSYSAYVALYYRADISSGGVCSQATGTPSYYRPNTKMVFAADAAAVEPEEPATLDCGKTLQTTIEGFKVFKHNVSGAIMYKAKMSIDADGSPRAYGPNNSGLDYTANAGYSGNWWGVVTNASGNPVIQGSSDPYPGMYVSSTSLVENDYGATNPLRYTNSEAVPFFVLPSAITSSYGISLGDVGYVYNTVTGQGCYAIFADGGPSGKLGEGSIYLANQLGINSNPKTGGVTSGTIAYIIFPGSGFGQGTIPGNAQIDSMGTARIGTLGGTAIVTCLNGSANKQEENENALSLTDEISSSETTLEIYPNPSDGKAIYGKVNSVENGTAMVKIYNLLGQEMYKERVSVSEHLFALPLSGVSFKEGIYMIAVNLNNEQIIKRIVIK